ncbi:MAG: leucine-rich repeat protein [Deltaproteobacteria bacterium]|jgi:internalin A|nr:leucine-rich repeat protein [Deltaproteobacteria bacterium]
MSDKVIVLESRAVASMKALKLAHPEAELSSWSFDEPGKVVVSGSARRALTVDDGRLVRLDLSGIGLQGRLVLSDLPHLEELSIMGAELGALKLVNLPDLDTLLLDRAFGFVSDCLMEFDELPVIKHLRANHCGIIDVSNLEPLVTLEILELNSNSIQNIEPLSELAMLRKLSISDNEIDYLGPLEDAIDLSFLDASINDVGDLSPLTGLTSLTRLDVSENPIETLEPIRGLKGLTELGIASTDIDDLGALSSLYNLATIDASCNSISDLSPLSRLRHLVVLVLGENSIYELDGLESLKNLETLVLSDNEIENLGPISRLVALKDLDVSFNRLTDISPLKNLRNLRTLNISSNDINDLTVLSRLPRLAKAYVSGNGNFEDEDVVLLGNPDDDDRGPLDAKGLDGKGPDGEAGQGLGGSSRDFASEGLRLATADFEEGEEKRFPPSVIMGGAAAPGGDLSPERLFKEILESLSEQGPGGRLQGSYPLEPLLEPRLFSISASEMRAARELLEKIPEAGLGGSLDAKLLLLSKAGGDLGLKGEDFASQWLDAVRRALAEMEAESESPDPTLH